MGQAAMQVNEGLPAYIVSALERRYGGAQGKTVGILGMAFKAESDDTRASLQLQAPQAARLGRRAVLCTDPYVQDDRLVPLDACVDESDILILGAPHTPYRGLEWAARTSSTCGAPWAEGSGSEEPRGRGGSPRAAVDCDPAPSRFAIGLRDPIAARRSSSPGARLARLDLHGRRSGTRWQAAIRGRVGPPAGVFAGPPPMLLPFIPFVGLPIDVTPSSGSSAASSASSGCSVALRAARATGSAFPPFFAVDRPRPPRASSCCRLLVLGGPLRRARRDRQALHRASRWSPSGTGRRSRSRLIAVLS